MDAKRDTAEDTREPPVNKDGVDLTQIDAMLAMTPTERVEYLVTIVRGLQGLRGRVRKL